MNLNSLLITIPIGVAAGVAANVLTHLFITVWLPAYRDFVYRGARVDGDWLILQAAMPVDNSPLATSWLLSATLKQKAYLLAGSATATQVEGDVAKDVINYDVVGYIYDRFISVTFRNIDRSRIAHSTFLLELKGDGSRMEGYRSFYGLRRETIRAIQCTWKRAMHHSATMDAG